MKAVKKPIVVEVMQFKYTAEDILKLREFCGDALGKVSKFRHHTSIGEAEIRTLEDGEEHFKVKHIAKEGDYIIKGPMGEFWPVKKEIFELTYEVVEE